MFVLDTNVVSELRKVAAGRADPRVAAWSAEVGTDLLFLSVVTIEEIEVGVLRKERQDAAQGALLRRWLEDRVLPAFADRLLPVTVEVARAAARLHVPDPRSHRDALIAATALVHGMRVVTRNVSDFAGSGVGLVNPWEGSGRG